MANKTATLKNQAGDNIYPNIVGDNRNAAIKDSATIKHTLAENKISLDLDETIKGKIDAALQKPTGLTKTKLVGVGTSGQENIEIGDNLTLTNGKLAAAGGASVSPTLWLINPNNYEVRTSITEEEYNNLKNGLYNQVIYIGGDSSSVYSPSKLFSIDGAHGFVQFKIDANANETLSYSSMVARTITVGEKNVSNEYPITINDVATINPPSSSGEGGGGGGSGMQIVDCTLTDQEDITKGGTVDNVPEVPFLLRIPLNLKNEGSYGKHLVDNILVPMNYTYGSFEHSGEGKVVPDKYSGTGFALTNYYYVEVDISTKKVTIVKQVNASYIALPVDMPTKTSPTVSISNPNQDILVQPMLVGENFASDGVVLYGYLFGWVSPVYSKNNEMFYYTAKYGDVANTFTITYHEIPSSTTTITFED